MVISHQGFLGTGAPASADLNLVIQLAMGAALISGAYLAKTKNYKAHGVCQSVVLLLNLVMIAFVMWPSFQKQVEPASAKALHRWYYEAAMIHALLGTTAEVLGLYIVIVAGTKILPERFRFNHWKTWMRAEFALWMFTLITGMGTYCAWYVAPFRNQNRAIFAPNPVEFTNTPKS